MTRAGKWPLIAALAVVAACAAGGPPPPAALETTQEACGYCRMVVFDPRLAAQLVAPMEEPVFFDDIGCLRDFLARSGDPRVSLPARALYVADHVTGAWVAAGTALYTKAEGFETPMGSHIIAHADEASRRSDPAARDGIPMTPAEVFGSTNLPTEGP